MKHLKTVLVTTALTLGTFLVFADVVNPPANYNPEPRFWGWDEPVCWDDWNPQGQGTRTCCKTYWQFWVAVDQQCTASQLDVE